MFFLAATVRALRGEPSGTRHPRRVYELDQPQIIEFGIRTRAELSAEPNAARRVAAGRSVRRSADRTAHRRIRPDQAVGRSADGLTNDPSLPRHQGRDVSVGAGA